MPNSKRPGPGKNEPLDEATRELIRAMRRARPGATITELAEAAGCSRGSASNVLRKGHGALPARAVAEEVSPSPQASTSFVVGPDGDEGLVGSYERLARQQLLDADAARLNGDLRLASQVTHQGVAALQRLYELRPPPKKDPSTDPANLAAREAVVSRVDELIDREEVGRAALAALEKGMA